MLISILQTAIKANEQLFEKTKRLSIHEAHANWFEKERWTQMVTTYPCAFTTLLCSGSNGCLSTWR